MLYQIKIQEGDSVPQEYKFLGEKSEPQIKPNSIKNSDIIKDLMAGNVRISNVDEDNNIVPFRQNKEIIRDNNNIVDEDV